jgi:acetyl-CoA carboxylase biotin carboxyl carrier protein
MDLEKIEGLVKIVENSSLMEFSLEEGDLKISMSKLDNPPVVAQGVPYVSAAAPAPAAAAPAAAAPVEEKEEEKLFITSPIVATFYSAPAPDAPAFVKVGEHVKNGQTVCILEAMKLMNEIQAEFDCEIEAVLVSNEQKVEYGQPLFRVKKL